jgi:hypothetical protein
VIAANATQIVEMRKHGRQPGSWVLVSFVGKIDKQDDGFTVYASPESEYDWRWIVGLDLIVFARKGQGIAHQLKAMRNDQPKTLSLWDVDAKTGAEVHFDYPAVHAEAHRKAKSKTVSIELDPWAHWQIKELSGMGY